MLKYIFKGFNYAVAFVMLLALCAVDSVSWIPFAVFFAALAYLIAVAWWQERFLKEGKRK